MDTTSSSSSQFYSSNNNTTTTSTSMGPSSRSREMESLSLEISKYPRDLLQLATNQSSSSSSSKRLTNPQLGVDEDEDEDDEGLNLGLGLSLGGKFGVDKYSKGLKRSSSIIGTMPLIKEDDQVAAPPQPAGLARTASLPLETEEEWRRRKEMQTLRRMVAKRRRFEKQRVSKEGGGGGVGEDKGVESGSFRGRLEKEQQNLGIANKFSGGSNPNTNPFGSSPTPKVEMKRRTTFGSLQGFLMAQAQTQNQGCSQGSGDSQGGSSSGASEHHQGSSNSGEGRSPASSHSTQDRSTIPETTGLPLGTKTESIPRRSEAESSGKQSTESSKRQEAGGGAGAGIEDMPCVFTIGDGPYGRKVEGILYKYGRGEEVRIMCVCHGSFFSPAEFVKHAGGRDVEHPLRHIVVSPSPATFP